MTTLQKHLRLSLLVAGLLGITGCQTLLTQSGSQALPLKESTGERVFVEVRPARGKPTRKQIPLQKDMRLQDAVSATKTKFHGKDIFIVRQSPRTGQKHKLNAVYDRVNRRVTLETDYAIQPGDRVVIAQDTTSAFERVMKNFLGRS